MSLSTLDAHTLTQTIMNGFGIVILLLIIVGVVSNALKGIWDGWRDR